MRERNVFPVSVRGIVLSVPTTITMEGNVYLVNAQVNHFKTKAPITGVFCLLLFIND